MSQLSGAQLLLILGLSLIWAVLGYRLSENDRRRLGRTPWGLPSMLWALFWFVSLVLGLVLYLIAHTNGVRRAQRQQFGPGVIPPTGAMSAGYQSVAQRFPAYPQPANAAPPHKGAGNAAPPHKGAGNAAPPHKGAGNAGEPSGAGAPAMPSAPPDEARDEQAPAAQEAVSPPAWHPDPSGRFQFRWWDGGQWTPHVATDGQVLVDTSPDQRIGPYQGRDT